MTTFTRRLPWFAVWLSRRAAAPLARWKRSDAALPRPAVHDASENGLELEERRAAALRRMFPKLYSWYANGAGRTVAVDVHRYLAGATNVTDLEHRIRAVEQNCQFRSFP